MDIVLVIGLTGVVCKKAIVDVVEGNVLDTLNAVRVKNAQVVVVCVKDVLVDVGIILVEHNRSLAENSLVLVDVKIFQVVVLVVVDVVCVVCSVAMETNERQVRERQKLKGKGPN